MASSVPEEPLDERRGESVYPDAQPPADHRHIRIRRPPRSAAGLQGVIATFKHAFREAGPARIAQVLLKINQKNGFDCQSCAWPNPDERHFAEFCENGAKAVTDEATTKRVTPDFFAQHSVAELAQESDYVLGKHGRITHPMILDDGGTHYRSINWAEAFETIAAELNQLASPDEAIFYTSGRTSNEAAFLYQLFVREFGTNNLPDCSNMCHESSGTALGETIGIGKGTVTLEDFQLADAIFIIGQNPGTNHPRMLMSLQAAVRRGCRIVSINPLPEPGLTSFKNPQEIAGLAGIGTPLATLWLQVRINGDVALLKGIMKEMLAAEETRGGVFDWNFIRSRTSGFDDFLDDLRAASWEEIVEQSGVAREEIAAAAKIAIESKRTICCWAMGLTQHKNAVGTIQEIVNFLLLQGSLGRPGAGACPVRGHSNVQGDRTMGIWERPKPFLLDNLEREFGFQPPRHHGFDTVNAIRAMHDGRAKVLIALGGNFLSATPDTELTAEALRRTRLTVHVSTKLNRSHLITGRRALILPCLGRTEVDRQKSGEQFVTVEDSMGIVSSSRGMLAPASEQLRSEPWIVARLAKATLGSRSRVDWDAMAANYDLVRDSISRVIPGFDDFNRRIRKGSFYLPNAVRDGEFRTFSGKAHFTVHPIPDHRLAADEYVMMTIRSHDQFNTTVYGLDDRYRGVYGGRHVVFMNREDAVERGFAEGTVVDLFSDFNGVRRTAEYFVVVPFDLPRRCTATYFPEANVLVPLDSVAEKSNTPTSKFVVITIEKSRLPFSNPKS